MGLEGGEGGRKWVRMLVVGGQNQRSGTFYGASNLSGLPETYLACFKMFFVQ